MNDHVKLRNGDSVPKYAIPAITMSLQTLMSSIEGITALDDLLRVCKGENFYPQASQLNTLEKYGLINREADGALRVHDVTRSIVLSSVVGELLDMQLVSPTNLSIPYKAPTPPKAPVYSPPPPSGGWSAGLAQNSGSSYSARKPKENLTGTTIANSYLSNIWEVEIDRQGNLNINAPLEKNHKELREILSDEKLNVSRLGKKPRTEEARQAAANNPDGILNIYKDMWLVIDSKDAKTVLDYLHAGKAGEGYKLKDDCYTQAVQAVEAAQKAAKGHS